MRYSNIRFHAEIPIPVNSDGSDPNIKMPSFFDHNGVTYEIQAIKAACDGVSKAPIICHGNGETDRAIGIANSAHWNDAGYIEVEGIIFFAGTNEEVIFSCSKDVVSMDIDSFGFG